MKKNEILKQVDQFLSDKGSYNIKKTNKSFMIKEEVGMNAKEQAPHKATVEYLKTFMYEHFVTKEDFHLGLKQTENNLKAYMHENFATKEDIKDINNRIGKLEIRMDNLETKVDAGFKLILDTLARNGMK